MPAPMIQRLALARLRLIDLAGCEIKRGVTEYLCSCSCAHKCPLGRTGSELRCSKTDLEDFIKNHEHEILR